MSASCNGRRAGFMEQTTAAGLIVGILIQFCYNFFANRIDKIIADMTEQTAAFIDLLAEREHQGA